MTEKLLMELQMLESIQRTSRQLQSLHAFANFTRVQVNFLYCFLLLLVCLFEQKKRQACVCCKDRQELAHVFEKYQQEINFQREQQRITEQMAQQQFLHLKDMSVEMCKVLTNTSLSTRNELYKISQDLLVSYKQELSQEQKINNEKQLQLSTALNQALQLLSQYKESHDKTMEKEHQKTVAQQLRQENFEQLQENYAMLDRMKLLLAKKQEKLISKPKKFSSAQTSPPIQPNLTTVPEKKTAKQADTTSKSPKFRNQYTLKNDLPKNDTVSHSAGYDEDDDFNEVTTQYSKNNHTNDTEVIEEENDIVLEQSQHSNCKEEKETIEVETESEEAFPTNETKIESEPDANVKEHDLDCTDRIEKSITDECVSDQCKDVLIQPQMALSQAVKSQEKESIHSGNTEISFELSEPDAKPKDNGHANGSNCSDTIYESDQAEDIEDEINIEEEEEEEECKEEHELQSCPETQRQQIKPFVFCNGDDPLKTQLKIESVETCSTSSPKSESTRLCDNVESLKQKTTDEVDTSHSVISEESMDQFLPEPQTETNGLTKADHGDLSNIEKKDKDEDSIVKTLEQINKNLTFWVVPFLNFSFCTFQKNNEQNQLSKTTDQTVAQSNENIILEAMHMNIKTDNSLNEKSDKVINPRNDSAADIETSLEDACHDISLITTTLKRKLTEAEINKTADDLAKSMLSDMLSIVWSDAMSIAQSRNFAPISFLGLASVSNRNAIPQDLWKLKIQTSKKFVGTYVRMVLERAPKLDWTSKSTVQIEMSVFAALESAANVLLYIFLSYLLIHRDNRITPICLGLDDDIHLQRSDAQQQFNAVIFDTLNETLVEALPYQGNKSPEEWSKEVSSKFWRPPSMEAIITSVCKKMQQFKNISQGYVVNSQGFSWVMESYEILLNGKNVDDVKAISKQWIEDLEQNHIWHSIDSYELQLREELTQHVFEHCLEDVILELNSIFQTSIFILFCLCWLNIILLSILLFNLKEKFSIILINFALNYSKLKNYL
ncbi:hypothetical protein RFI_01232 [Reticulomyxa filosa]|uniref:Uncharacterized protein n=1 Tax=Reticulomyxa filosa TaxID=46433 RepID=X6PDT8_RETFI|nr:hypothetical protein RFI_01232 [Reticulomyxa filosa]|eukprot:ETO35832.1 hypothetical protein RFI_01232 [Reticulomyxa filosa]